MSSSHLRRGFSLLEMGWIMGIMAVLVATGAMGWASLRSQADGDRPRAQLTTVTEVQRQAFQTRGSFADSPLSMSSLESNYQFVAGDQPATSLDGANKVSVSATAGSGSADYTAVAYAAALSDAGICYGIRIPDPRSGDDPVQVRRTAVQAPLCSATTISEGQGSPW